MRIAIELSNGSGCSLDSKIVDVVEGDDLDIVITRALLAFIMHSVIAPGDTIKIVEVP